MTHWCPPQTPERLTSLPIFRQDHSECECSVISVQAHFLSPQPPGSSVPASTRPGRQLGFRPLPALRTSHDTSLAKRFGLSSWTSYGVFGKALPACLLDTLWHAWQSASGFRLEHRMASLAQRFQLGYWTPFGVLGKALPTCLLNIVWRPWQSASHSPV